MPPVSVPASPPAITTTPAPGSTAARGVDDWPALVPGRGPPHPLARLAVAMFVAAVSAVLTFRWYAGAPLPPDFWFPHTAARALAAWLNPYQLPLGSDSWPSSLPLFYPLTAVAVVRPLAALPLATAGATFMATSSGLLAWFLTRWGLTRALLFATGSYLMAVRLGQWSPALCLAAILPGAGWLATTKPTIGLAMLVARPSRTAFLLAGAFGVATLLLLASWPLDWLRTIRATSQANLYLSPIATRWGWPLAFALLRWRRPEARLLLALACVPQVPAFADQLALALVARTRTEVFAYSAVNLTLSVLWLDALTDWSAASVTASLPYVMLGCYLPALLLVLLKPNEGAVPAWLDAALVRLQRAPRPPAS